MLDGALEQIIATTLTNGLTAFGIAGVAVRQNNQPRQFVAPSTPTIFFTKASPTKPYGWPARRDVWNATTQQFDTTQTQVMHTRYQIAGCAPRSPAAPFAYSSSDLVSIAMNIVHSDASLASYVSQNCNIFRISELPNVWFQDSSGQNVQWASFDIIFTHKDVYGASTPAISEFDGSFGNV